MDEGNIKRQKIPLKSAAQPVSSFPIKTSTYETPRKSNGQKGLDPPSSPVPSPTLDIPPALSADGTINVSLRKKQLARQSRAEEKLKAEAMAQLRGEVAIDEGQEGFFPALTRTDTNDMSLASSFTYEEDLNGKPRRRRRKNTFSDEEFKNIPRLVHRNLAFKQSKQEIAVVTKTTFKSLKLQRILTQDWYHVFLRQNTFVSVCILLAIWTFWIFIFALVYMHVDRQKPQTSCGLGGSGEPIKFNPAFAFSLETCTTVGYGLPNGTNGFFETECSALQVAIFFQMMWSMLFNAFLFAFLFARLARCESRGAQVLFSDKAILEIRDGKWMMHVRIYDFDAAQPVVEAHVRMYCVSWRDYERQTRDLVQPHLLHTMRILQPDDELGANLFTSIPANVTHQVDAFSPLAPLKLRRRVKYLANGGLPLREADQDNGSRHGVLCPVCGETFGTIDQLRRHVQYMQVTEKHDEYPVIGSHRDSVLIKPDLFKPFTVTEDQLREQLRDKEIMVVVEGIEPMVSGTFQALQSYKLNDIVFGGRFEPCMSQQGGKIYVDVDKFHKILPPDDHSVHRYREYNGGHTHQLTSSASLLPHFFKSGTSNENSMRSHTTAKT